MNKDALEQAEERLSRAEDATRVLEARGDKKARESAWLDVLSALSTVYSKIEQGVKGGQGVSWFVEKQKERKSDPLLQYLQQARNSAEHGIVRGSRYAEKSVSFTGAKPGTTVGFRQTSTGLQPYSNDPDLKLNVVSDDVSLTTVRNRGVIYHAPTEHLGKPLADTGASTVARAAVEYLREMLNEAAAFVEDGHNLR